ncbi:hypothetical protein [Streptomyces sp. NP-1717]|uniref:hypothetical protein n=1 Tax=Streptomyces sp. NP-1717 TaxID=2704470 RepID=UPI001F5CD5ED|nr:hypothetical protein [Streptomyces sp. NP-1717]MCI3223976.1 hypothetical protein [Streptomyces sp. NP-1717]
MSAVRQRRPSWIRPREKNLSNYERNVRRIRNPPPHTLGDRLHVLLSRAENVWCQHVTQRELFRQLDALRKAMNHPAPREAPTPATDAEVRTRLARLAADHHETTSRYLDPPRGGDRHGA